LQELKINQLKKNTKKMFKAGFKTVLSVTPGQGHLGIDWNGGTGPFFFLLFGLVETGFTRNHCSYLGFSGLDFPGWVKSESLLIRKKKNCWRKLKKLT